MGSCVTSPERNPFDTLTEPERRGLRACGELLQWLARREHADSAGKLIPIAAEFYAELGIGVEFMRKRLEKRKDSDLTEGVRGSV